MGGQSMPDTVFTGQFRGKVYGCAGLQINKLAGVRQLYVYEHGQPLRNTTMTHDFHCQYENQHQGYYLRMRAGVNGAAASASIAALNAAYARQRSQCSGAGTYQPGNGTCACNPGMSSIAFIHTSYTCTVTSQDHYRR